MVYVDATSGIYPPTGFSFGVINATSHSVIKTLPLDVVPGAIALDEAKGYVYVAGSDSIEVFYEGTQTFVGNLSVGLPIFQMAFDALGTGNLFLTSGGRVYEITPPTAPTNTYRVVANASTGTAAGALALDGARDRLYVTDYQSDSVLVFEASTLNLLGAIRLPTCCPVQLALNPKTQTLYATTGTNFVEIMNAKTDSFMQSVEVAPSKDNSTSLVAVDTGTGRAFVSFSSGDSIAEVEQNGALSGYLRVTTTPAGMSIDSLTGELYVANYHQLTVLDARGATPGPDYTLAALTALGSVAAAVALIIVLRSPAWKERNRPTVE